MIKVDKKMIEGAKTNLLNTDEFVGIKTGFNNIDSFTNGFANGQLIILGGRPSMGKTTFACSLIDNVCIIGGKSCALCMCEMSARQTIERLIRLHGNVKYSDKEGPEFTDCVKRATEDFESTRLWIDDTSVGIGDEFIESCRRIGEDERIDLVIVDYLQLFESETKDLSGLLMNLKQLAVELDCPVLVLTQLKRSVENRRDHLPRISDIPNGKIIETCADEILFLYREAYYDCRANVNNALINIAKHDKCPRLNTSIYFDPDIPAFRTDDFFLQKKRRGRNMNERSELHCHTKMSEMSGLADVRELIQKAKEMGMPAIAITDNDTVQAFPEAFREWWRDDHDDSVKVLFGVEASMVDDQDAVVMNDKGQSFDSDFVVIDTETTGLSPVSDKIIEIGAVRISGGKIVDVFSTFVNPGIHIPEMITELTGISDEMIDDSDSIEVVLPKLMEFCHDAVLVTHNAPFDMAFVRENLKHISTSEDFTIIDTLNLARMLLDIKRHTLSEVAEYLKIPVTNLHRAADDAELTARVFLRLIDILEKQSITTLQEAADYSVKNFAMTRHMISHKVIVIPTSLEGMRDLYNIISEVNILSFDSYLKIPKSMLVEKREGLCIGCCAQRGEVSQAIFDNQSDEYIRKIIGFYDFLEVEPVDNYIWVLSQSPKIENLTADQVKENIKRVVKIGEEEAVPVVASSNVYYVNKDDIDAFKVLRHASGFKDSHGWKAKHHLMSAKELLKEFDFLGEETARELVINNPNRVAAELGVVQPISPEKQYPVYPDAYLKLKDICYKKANEIYGNKLPKEVKTRIEYELNGIKQNDFASLYMISYELVKKSNDAGYLVGSRGCSGASFVSFLAGITDTNPLPAHYLCKGCKYTDFNVIRIKGYRRGDLGVDLPNKKCPVCGSMLSKAGFDLPVETFLGFNLDKEPNFDMNFAAEYQHEAQCSVCEIDGVGEICRAGTIESLSERKSRAYAEKYFKEKKSRRSKDSILKVADKLVGVRRCNGVHPGGIIAMPKGVDICEYTPVGDCCYDGMPQTLIEYHSLDGKLLKIDVLGHNAPSLLKYLSDETGIDPRDIQFGEDKKVLSLFSSTEALGICPADIKGITVGTVGIPEYGLCALKLMELIRPKRSSDIIKISSMMHGTQVWNENAEIIVQENPQLFSECIASRDDIMLYLLSKGFEREEAFKIMEYVRKGKARYGLKEEWLSNMRKAGVPEWYISSCEKIMYLFPKSHCAHYSLMSWRMLYYKLYYPEAFYRGWAKYYDAESLLEKGYEYASTEYDKLAKKNPSRLGWNQIERMDDCLVIIEMHARGIHLG